MARRGRRSPRTSTPSQLCFSRRRSSCRRSHHSVDVPTARLRSGSRHLECRYTRSAGLRGLRDFSRQASTRHALDERPMRPRVENLLEIQVCSMHPAVLAALGDVQLVANVLPIPLSTLTPPDVAECGLVHVPVSKAVVSELPSTFIPAEISAAPPHFTVGLDV